MRTICVPHYEGLSLAHMSKELLMHHSDIYNYMPDQVEIHKTPK